MDEIVTARRRRKTKAACGATVHDVARVAGVSTASVSRALSRPELVSEAVHDRVKAAIQDLAYVPNAAARSLSGRSARLVGVVVATLNDPVTTLALETMTRELGAGGVALVLSVVGEGGAAACVRALLARGVDAIVFGAGAAVTPPATLVPGSTIAYGSLDEAVSGESSLGSGFDRVKAQVLAARYLQQHGHVRIALFAVGGERGEAAVRMVLTRAGIEVDPTTSLGVGAALDDWWARAARPTAVICGSDAAAAAMLGECQRREIAVPAQFSVVGFGDTEISRHAHPGITTVRVPAREAGRALAKNLLARLEGRPHASPELFAKIVARESTGVAAV